MEEGIYAKGLTKKEYMKQWRKNNKDKKRKYDKKWRKNNREKSNAIKKRWLDKNPEYKKLWQKRATENHKKLWLPVIEKIFGEIACQRCGYKKCFAALDFHHKNKEDKKENPSNILRWKITEERIEELKKCELLCANCHREEHSEEFT